MDPRGSPWWLAAAALATLPLVACLDLSLVAGAAFPAGIPGLAAAQGWAGLPLGSWITESPVKAEAIALCGPPACASETVAGLFRFQGRDAEAAARLLRDPRAVERLLAARASGAGARGPRPAKPPPPTTLTVERFGEAPLAGVAVRLARRDGTQPVTGILLGRPAAAGGWDALIVLARDDEAARRVAREAARAALCGPGCS